jgi:hypothetical protein
MRFVAKSRASLGIIALQTRDGRRPAIEAAAARLRTTRVADAVWLAARESCVLSRF